MFAGDLFIRSVNLVPVRLILFISLSFFADISRAAICRFHGLGDLPGGEFFSKAYGISADGSVVVGESKSALGEPFEAFRWESDVLSSLTAPGDPFFASSAYAISADSSVIVGLGYSQTRPYSEAFRWTESGGVQGLGGFPPVFAGSRAYGASADGSVIVGEAPSATDFEAFRWSKEEGMVGLGRTRSTAYAVSADGSVIVGESRSATAQDHEAFRWTKEEGMVGLGFLEPVEPIFAYSGATAVSADGSVIVGYSASPLPVPAAEAFRWEDGVMTGLGVGGFAWAVSADGSVIVGENRITDRAFIWDAKYGTRDLKDVLVDECGLELTGWTLERATGVSADGLTIVGYGTNPAGFTEGWIATIPEPVTFLLLTFGGLALLKKRRPCSGFRIRNSEVRIQNRPVD